MNPHTVIKYVLLNLIIMWVVYMFTSRGWVLCGFVIILSDRIYAIVLYNVS